MIYKEIKIKNINYSIKKLIKFTKFLKKNKNLIQNIIKNKIKINLKAFKIIKNIINSLKLLNNNIYINNIIIKNISINKYIKNKKLYTLAKGKSSIIKKNKSIIILKIIIN